MKQELRFNGYTAQPSDYECQDGDLAAVLNLMPEKGALHPVNSPISLGNFPGADVLYVHETTGGRKYILYDRSLEHLKWTINSSATPSSLTEPHTGRPLHISAIGNTLVVHMSDGVYYFLWKEDDYEYETLGSRIPEISLSFGLQSEVGESEWSRFEVTDAIPQADLQRSAAQQVDLSDANKTLFTSAILAEVNKFIAEKGTNAGKFIMPFFVRYALRLYDGTLIHHSAPVFMPCASDVTPAAIVSYGGGSSGTFLMQVIGAVHTLDYQADAIWSALEKWSDIITSVDIFISAPLYKYDQSGRVEKIGPPPQSVWSLSKQTDRSSSSAPLRYQVNSLDQLYYMKYGYGLDEITLWQTWAVLPSKSDEEFMSSIRSCSNFYLLKSIPLDKLSQTRVALDVAADYLQSLVSREVMTDDYDSHDDLIADVSFVYNQRLNLAGLKKRVFSGFDSFSALPYSDGFVNKNGGISDDETYDVSFYVYLKKDGKTIVVKDSQVVEGSIAFGVPLIYFYYPSTAAYKVVVKRGDDGWEFPLTPHDFLNGSVYVGPYYWITSEKIDQAPVVSVDTVVDIQNKVYTSDVGNPFSFPLLGISTVGTGRIIGLSTAAKALSEGQFGQFPLYVFSEDGVWAMEVSATGTFSARQPITRDVCINPDSITQIDSAVLFATDRGIMLISGSETICISGVMDNNEEPFDFTSMPLASEIQDMLHESNDDVFPERPFSRDFLSGCQMIYVYNRQQILVFNKDYDYAYIYSLESKAWGMMRSNIVSRVISYPEAIAMTSESDRLVDFSKNTYLYQSDDVVVLGPQFLITRPIKLDPSLKDTHKTIDTVIVRGNFAKGHVKTVLYGSRDLRNWFPVASSVDHYLRGFRGTPYKYFRIALICSLGHDESIWGCTIQYTPRLINQPR